MLQQTVETLVFLKHNAKELNLEGMDSIVDRAEGRVSPERVKAITDKLAALEAKKADLFAIGQRTENAAAAATFNTQLESLKTLLQQDLPKAIVEFGTVQDAPLFAVLDDEIDTTVTTITDVLEPLIVNAQNDMRVYFSSTKNKANEALLWSAGIFCFMLGGQSLLVHFMSGGIVRGINRLIQRFEEQTMGVFGELSSTSKKRLLCKMGG